MRDDIAYFLTCSVSKSSALAQEPVKLDDMIQTVKTAVEGEYLCSFSSKVENTDAVIICFDCDGFGGSVKELDEEDIIKLLSPISALYVDVYFQLDCDNTDQKTNQVYIFKGGQYRKDSSIQIDSALSLEASTRTTHFICCQLDTLEVSKVKQLLDYCGGAYSIDEP